MSEEIAFSGKVGEVVHTTFDDGRVFEKYRRAPGTRIIVVSPENKILVTKEYRHENGAYDVRLPGGKVRDTLEEYHQLLQEGTDITQAASDAAKKEALEEVGLKVDNLELLTVANSGATVEWDLYYFLTRDFKESTNGQQLEHGEDIETSWLSPEEIVNAIKNHSMSEWRSVGVLLGLVIPSIQQS